MRKKVLKVAAGIVAAVAAIGAGVAVYLNYQEGRI